MDLLNNYGLALGWTLIHMLWISLAIAIGVQVFRLMVKDSQLKYSIGLTALSLIPLIAIGLFVYLLQGISSIVAVEGGNVIAELIPVIVVEQSEATLTLAGWLEQHMDWIVVLWFAGMLSFVARLGFGYTGLNRLRGSMEPLNDFWIRKFLSLKMEFGLETLIEFGSSKLISSPLTFGFFKPAILLPVGMVNALSVEEVEAIIRHELAHIARHDFIFKMIQSAIESIFYYSPGTWWLSKMIDIDREHCCDDHAILSGSSTSAYIKALYKVNTFNTHESQLALGFGKQKNQLLNRIKRILKQPQENTNIMGRLLIPVGLLLVVALVSINATSDKYDGENEFMHEEMEAPITPISEMEFPEIEMPAPILRDTTDKPKSKSKSKSTTRSSVNANGKSYSVTRENGAIKEMIVDGKKIDPVDYDKYEQEFRKSMEDDGMHFDFKDGDGPFTKEEMKEFEEKMESFGNSFEYFGKDNEEWNKRMEQFEKEMEDWGKNFEMEDERMKEYEERMAEWGERFGRTFGKDFGNSMAEWGESFGEKFKHGFHFDFDTEGLKEWGEEIEERLEEYRQEHPEDFYQDEEGEWHLKKDNLTDEEAEEIFGEGWIEDLMANTMDLMKGFDFKFDFDDNDFEFVIPPMPPMPPMPAYPGAKPFKLELKSFKSELKKDGHFNDNGKANIKMDEQTLKINGKVQSKRAYKRYAEIIKKDWGEDYLEKYEIDFTIIDKDSNNKKKIKGTYRI